VVRVLALDQIAERALEEVVSQDSAGSSSRFRRKNSTAWSPYIAASVVFLAKTFFTR